MPYEHKYDHGQSGSSIMQKQCETDDGFPSTKKK
jgi:hypothetical protein